MMNNIKLYRPTGANELELIIDSLNYSLRHVFVIKSKKHPIKFC